MKKGPLTYLIYLLFYNRICIVPGTYTRSEASYCMAYDINTKSIVVFGGADEKEVKNHTWLYKKGKWEQLKKQGTAEKDLLEYDL